MGPLLEAHQVTKVFGGGLFHRRGTMALEDLSLAIHEARPSITAIAGESGSGKTTLARLLLGIIRPTSGTILYKGRDLHGMARGEWPAFRRDVQAIFQDPFEAFNPFYQVDHVLTTAVHKFGLAASPAAGREVIEEALREVGLRPEETLGRHPHQLSGGQRQRVMVARAMLIRPRIIIADEPVSMVDASLRATILESLLTMNRELGISIVYITHDLTTAYQVSDQIVVLYRGSVAEAGDVEAVIKRPQHPYTRLLVESIPTLGGDVRWGREPVPAVTTDAATRALSTGVPARPGPTDTQGALAAGCKFADRCPHVMPVCRTSVPPQFRTETHRSVACFLYQDAPTAVAARSTTDPARSP